MVFKSEITRVVIYILTGFYPCLWYVGVAGPKSSSCHSQNMQHSRCHNLNPLNNYFLGHCSPTIQRTTVSVHTVIFQNCRKAIFKRLRLFYLYFEHVYNFFFFKYADLFFRKYLYIYVHRHFMLCDPNKSVMVTNKYETIILY